MTTVNHNPSNIFSFGGDDQAFHMQGNGNTGLSLGCLKNTGFTIITETHRSLGRTKDTVADYIANPTPEMLARALKQVQNQNARRRRY